MDHEAFAYDQELKQLRETEFRHAQGVTYLDHAGATLYSSRQLEAHVRDLTTNLYGNPHSQNPSSHLTSKCVEHVRELVLRHFGTNADSYDVVFTSGCTAALKLLGESFPWASSMSLNDATRNDTAKPSTDVVYVNTEGGGTVSLVDGSSVYCYLEDNHTSVVGMREVATTRGSSVVCARPNLTGEKQHIHQNSMNSAVLPASSPVSSMEEPHHLFAYPAQSNFSGCKYPLEWITDIAKGNHPVSSLRHIQGSWKVLLDAAAFVSTSPLDLSNHPAHFVALSFYKMFGFPTGLGALLVRRDCWELLHKEYYGGGTVVATISRKGFHSSRPQLHERLEDGTLPFLDIVALQHGFSTLTRIGRSMQHISKHSFSLARHVYYVLKDMQHTNGSPLCVLYHTTSSFDSPDMQGPIVNFNLLQADGSYVGYSEVEALASAKGIHLRTGCFCNTGACMIHLGLTSQAVLEHLEAGHVCGDTLDLVNGRPTGSVRISFGYMSTLEDAKTFVCFIQECFLSSGCNTERSTVDDRENYGGELRGDLVTRGSPGTSQSWLRGGVEEEKEEEVMTHSLEGRSVLAVGDLFQTNLKDGSSGGTWVIEHLVLYPVKSCAALKVASWPVGERGLVHDREWMVVGEQPRTVLSQKQQKTLCLIQPHIDRQAGTLTLSAPGCDPLVLPLKTSSPGPPVSLEAKVCGETVEGVDCGSAASSWLSDFLGLKCRLVRQKLGSQRRSQVKGGKVAASREAGGLLSLANRAQYLLVTRESVDELHQHESINSVLSTDDLLWRFRPNLVVSSQTIAKSDIPPLASYPEEKWSRLAMADGKTFQVVEECIRCTMIDVDQSSAVQSHLLQRTLSSLRGRNPKFGILLSHDSASNP